jgi:hypothetical protein
MPTYLLAICTEQSIPISLPLDKLAGHTPASLHILGVVLIWAFTKGAVTAREQVKPQENKARK